MEIQAFKITLDYQELLLGTVPLNKDVYTDFVAQKAIDAGAITAATAAEEVVDVQEIADRGRTGFLTDEHGAYVLDYYVKGFLKETANVLKDQIAPMHQRKKKDGTETEAKGIMAMKSKVENCLFVTPRKLYFTAQPDMQMVKSVLERPIRAQTAMGPRVSLISSDALENASLTFVLKILKNNEIGPEQVKELLAFGELRGQGQWRSGGYGRFTVRSFEEVTPA
jgi:hypothetical protein